MADRLMAGERLRPGESLISQNKQYELILQGDDNFVLYWRGVGPLWATGTNGRRIEQAVMQSDGNFVLYGAGGAVWATGTNGPGRWLIVQHDGNVVIYGPNGPVWATNTVLPDTVLQAGNFVVDNQSDHTIYVKPENSGEAVSVQPHEVYRGRHDGISAPHIRNGKVFKTSDYVGATVTNGGIETHVPVLRYFATFQEVRGGAWLNSPPDSGWDALFATNPRRSEDNDGSDRREPHDRPEHDWPGRPEGPVGDINVDPDVGRTA